jgi:hypothetical protein
MLMAMSKKRFLAVAFTSTLVALMLISQAKADTIHNGDIILNGSEIMTLTSEEVILNGSLTMNDNSKLILNGASLSPLLANSASYKLYGNSEIIIDNGSFLDARLMGASGARLYDNSTIIMTDSSIQGSIYGNNNCSLQTSNSQLYDGSATLGKISMLNSGAYGLTSRNTTLINSTAQHVTVLENAQITNSTIGTLEIVGNAISCDIVNSKYTSIIKDHFTGTINVEWYLMMVVTANGHPIEGAEVQVYRAIDNLLVSQISTSGNGAAQFVLPQWIINELGSKDTANYVVKANFEGSQSQANVDLDSSKEISLELQAPIPTQSSTIEPTAEPTPTPKQPSGFLGTNLPMEYGYAIIAVLVIVVVAGLSLVYLKKVRKN